MPRSNFAATLIAGFALGLGFFLFLSSVSSYQAEHCAKVQHSSRDRLDKKEPTQAVSEDKDREVEISDYAESHPGACGIVGFPRMIVGYMDHHEGFFVSFFTALLFVVTGLLAVFTFQLVTDAKDANAKQIKATGDALKAAQQSAAASAKQADASIAANRAHVRISDLSPMIDTKLILREARNNAPYTGIVACKWTLKNFGLTPADIYSVAFNAQWAINHTELISYHVSSIQPTIGSNEKTKVFKHSANVTVTNEQHSAIVRGIGFIFFVIDVTYFDIFGEVQGEKVYWKYKRDRHGNWSAVEDMIDRRAVKDRAVKPQA